MPSRRPTSARVLSDIDQITQHADLYVATWSPGDGVTRYRFFVEPGNSYFGPQDGIYTALGKKEAIAFLTGVRLAKLGRAGKGRRTDDPNKYGPAR